MLKVSFAAFLTLGVLSFVIMWVGNEKCAALLNNPNAAYGIKALAPGVVCVGCLAAFRGLIWRHYSTDSSQFCIDNLPFLFSFSSFFRFLLANPSPFPYTVVTE